VQSRMNKGFGPLRIEAELRERGTPAEAIKAWVNPSAQHWREQARTAWRKRFVREPKDYQERARQMRFLQQRGYTTDQINAVFKCPQDL
ncbi:MAG: regulatory protein RecX, partial [Gammaproteobacteria bacterium]